MPEQAKVGRLAFRVEGPWWNAYYAMPDTMQGAVLLGSVHMSLASQPEIKAAFMAFMRQCVGHVLSGPGRTVTWPNEPKPAPEHERTKE